MVIGDRFVWAHIPRTAGDLTHRLFEIMAQYTGEPLIIDDIGLQRKHDSFAMRPESLGKVRVANIRHLPNALLSYIQCHSTLSKMEMPVEADFIDNDSDYGNRVLGKVEKNWLPGPLATLPDRYLDHLMSDGILVEIWMRTEVIREDFIQVFGPFSIKAEREMRCVPTKPLLEYPHDVSIWFNPATIARMYDNNPKWASIERMVSMPSYLVSPLADIQARGETAIISGSNPEVPGSNPGGLAFSVV